MTTSTRPDVRPWSADLLATGALALYSLSAALGFARVFADWSFLDELVPIILVGHGVGLLTRRVRLRAWVAIPVTLGAVVWLLAVLFYPDTLTLGLPTTETWELFRLEMTAVREQFRVAIAPVVYGGGWDVLAGVGVATAVVLGDAFAFRAYARAESLVPGGVLFVFVGALGAERSQVLLTMVLVAAGVLTVVVLRWYHAGDQPRGRQLALQRTAPAAAVAIAVIAVGAAVIGPRLPGARADALYDTTTGSGGSASLVSPLVDIRSRLTNRSDAELFRVNADVESYWRSTTLPYFDGTTWTLPDESLESADGQLGAPSGEIENRQRVTIRGLEGQLVPAAPEPFAVSGPSDIGWVRSTSTLLSVEDDLSSGDVIDIRSASPVLDAATLAPLTSDAQTDAIFTQLPEGLPSIVADTARTVTADAQSPYEAAIALQRWFQEEFDYSLEVQPGHGNNAIETFMRERVGYCEQFAGTYAAMLRTLGIPTRVAVGFTSGEQVGERVWAVRGRNAHAWPEVWFDGVGWVGFEPTPGRGAPNAESYTGLAPQQDELPGEPVDDEEVDEQPAASLPPRSGPNLPPEEMFPEPGGGGALPRIDESGGGFSPLPFVVGGVLALLVALPWAVRRLRRRHRGGSAEAQLARAWSRALETVRGAGVEISASATPLEAASTTERDLPIVARPFAQLADVVTDATYGPQGMEMLEQANVQGTTTIRRCWGWERRIERAVNESATTAQRVVRYFTVWR